LGVGEPADEGFEVGEGDGDFRLGSGRRTVSPSCLMFRVGLKRWKGRRVGTLWLGSVNWLGSSLCNLAASSLFGWSCRGRAFAIDRTWASS